jgi:erythromycin esterase
MELLKNHPRKTREARTSGSIVGVVVAPDGAPLNFALVSAVDVRDDPEDGPVPLLTTTLDRGKFTFDDIPPGNYGLTVTAPAANAVRHTPAPPAPAPVPAGAFAGVVSVQAGEDGPPILIRLRSQALVLRGHVTGDAGAPIAGALVRAVRESPFEGDHFFAKTDDRGGFVLGIPEGRYFLVGQAPGRKPTRVELDGSGAPDDIDVRLPPAPSLPSQQQMAAWVSETGSALASADGGDTAELAKLRAIVGDARLVAFGDASYTGGETSRLELRMLRYLVEEMGFSTLLIEAGQADVRAVDEHVVHGKDNLAALLQALGYFSFDTEEMATALTWMQRHNEDRRKKPKLRLFGVDPQRTAAAAGGLDAYLTKVDRPFVQTVETTLSRLRSDDFTSALRKRPRDEQDHVLAELDAVAQGMDKNRRLYIARTNLAEYTTARDDAASLVWAIRLARDPDQRSAALADLTKRTLEALPRGTRAVLWAHSSQVSRRPADGGMGALLAGSLGKDYVALGLTFYQGWVRAWDFTTGATLEHGTKLFRLPPAEPGTLEALLDTAGIPLFFADVRKAPPPLLPWLESRLSMRNVGAAFVSDRRARTRTVVKEAFDGLVFVKKLTTVRFNETGKRPGRREEE